MHYINVEPSIARTGVTLAHSDPEERWATHYLFFRIFWRYSGDIVPQRGKLAALTFLPIPERQPSTYRTIRKQGRVNVSDSVAGNYGSVTHVQESESTR